MGLKPLHVVDSQTMLRAGLLKKYHDIDMATYYGADKDITRLKEFFPDKSRKFLENDLKDAQDIFSTVKFYIENMQAAIKKGKGIFFYGNSGTGKTLLMALIVKEALKKRIRVRMVSSHAIIQRTAATWDKDSDVDFDHEMLHVPLLCVEELNKEFHTALTTPTLTRVIKYREANMKATCFTCNEDMADIKEKHSNAMFSAVKGMCKELVFDSTLDWRDIEQANWQRDILS